ncbi:endolytic transglycosylase MltG [Deinococcus ruber]|uniref:Endolytic murein transglycosylase n=1 Tax=Deinococcus ruber TaxID=1848197 RepID=A0A918F7N9_9DEIO|nr:endolytic transglycosylase MltG [Deinococcus ruber]GGR08247.1 aminodeoxychorismate lyase [Deinococcus ruber]
MNAPAVTPPPGAPLPPRRRGWRWWHVLLLLLVLILLVVGGAAAYIYDLTRPPAAVSGNEKQPYTLEVKPGDTLMGAAERLQQAGIVRSGDVLRTIMRVRGTAGRLREGYYDLPVGLDAFQVAERLADTPRPRVRTVTIPEGKRLKDLPAIFAAAGLGDAAGLKASLNDAKLSRYARGTLEGFLFPATYPFRPEVSSKDIVNTLVTRMEQEFTPERVATARKLGLSVADWVTLASMVQAEAANTAEMPTIAGIFLNRLKEDIALGADPTVAYGLGKDLNQLDRSAGDFTKDTPYNTYTRRGLPAGPINNPGEAALLSILSSRRTTAAGKQALYFVHGLDGKIHVNSDYAAHLRDVARYR